MKIDPLGGNFSLLAIDLMVYSKFTNAKVFAFIIGLPVTVSQIVLKMPL